METVIRTNQNIFSRRLNAFNQFKSRITHNIDLIIAPSLGLRESGARFFDQSHIKRDAKEIIQIIYHTTWLICSSTPDVTLFLYSIHFRLSQIPLALSRTKKTYRVAPLDRL